ncbi:DUF4224 domain-containing protein [Pseudoteredinibacter isoporae]|uniref:DUF4224 domain-containing protein n=1 Tax=Pseudoteredinibacter isoporae TaxID=570281 RepID=UPI0031078105
MSALLSQEELIAITDRKRAKDQIKVLRDNGIQPFISADGKPPVTWDMVSRLSQLLPQVGNDDGFNIEGLR